MGAGKVDEAKGPWKSEEDAKLVALIGELGTSNWSTIAKQMPGRNGKSCRLRWFNQLSPDLNKEQFTPQEDNVIIHAHNQHGNRWSLIAKFLKGRTDNAVKNRWNSTLRRRMEANPSAGTVAGAEALCKGGDQLEAFTDEFETVLRIFKAIQSESRGTTDVDMEQVQAHVMALKRILLPESEPTDASARSHSMPIHFDNDPCRRQSTQTSEHNPMLRVPGLSLHVASTAAKSLEEVDEDGNYGTKCSIEGCDRMEMSFSAGAELRSLQTSSLPLPLMGRNGGFQGRAQERSMSLAGHSVSGISDYSYVPSSGANYRTMSTPIYADTDLPADIYRYSSPAGGLFRSHTLDPTVSHFGTATAGMRPVGLTDEADANAAVDFDFPPRNKRMKASGQDFANPFDNYPNTGFYSSTADLDAGPNLLDDAYLDSRLNQEQTSEKLDSDGAGEDDGGGGESRDPISPGIVSNSSHDSNRVQQRAYPPT